MRASAPSRRRCLLALALTACLVTPALAQNATVGQAAPAFELRDTSGKSVKLSDYKGKHVVLEWTNPGCPFVVKHYGSQNMQACRRRPRPRAWSGSASVPPRRVMPTTAPTALAAQYQTGVRHRRRC